MNFNIVSTLLAVSSAHDTIHIFKLDTRAADPSASRERALQASPPTSIDSREGVSGLDGGYEAYIEQKHQKSISWVISPSRVSTKPHSFKFESPTQDPSGDKDPGTFGRRVPSYKPHRDVGACTRLRFSASTHKWREMHCSP